MSLGVRTYWYSSTHLYVRACMRFFGFPDIITNTDSQDSRFAVSPFLSYFYPSDSTETTNSIERTLLLALFRGTVDLGMCMCVYAVQWALFSSSFNFWFLLWLFSVFFIFYPNCIELVGWVSASVFVMLRYAILVLWLMGCLICLEKYDSREPEIKNILCYLMF